MKKGSALFWGITLLCLCVTLRYLHYLNDNTGQISASQPHAPVTDRQFKASTITNAMIQTFMAELPSYLPQFKSPCWQENLPNDTNLYKNNIYLLSHEKVKERLYSINKYNLDLQKNRKTTRLRCLPYYYIAGFSKCGTTDLYYRIKRHPQVKAALIKEPRFWTMRLLEQYDIVTGTSGTFGHYVDLFDSAAAEVANKSTKDSEGHLHFPVVIGDGTPSYLWDSGEWWNNPLNLGLSAPRFIAAHYIKHFTPNAKFIVIMRNPTDRLLSDFRFFPREDKSLKAFHKLVVNCTEYIKKCVQTRLLRECFYEQHIGYSDHFQFRIRVSHYYVFLHDWLTVFPRDQFLFLKFEEYASNNSQVMSQVTNFLGLDAMPKRRKARSVAKKKSHINANKENDGIMLPETREILDKYFELWNQKLANLLQQEKFLWRD